MTGYDLDGMARAASERLRRSIWQRCRYAKAMIAFQADMDIDFLSVYPLHSTGQVDAWTILDGSISAEKMGRQRWDIPAESGL